MIHINMAIPFHRVNNHIDMDPSDIIPIIWFDLLYAEKQLM